MPFQSHQTCYEKLISIVIFGVLSLSLQATSDDYSDWQYTKQVNINTTSTGGDITGGLAEFPLLVRLSSSDFTFSQAESDGADLRFSNSSGVNLDYEIERFDATNEVAEIWVLVDTINGDDSTQYINMYWGNSGASAASDGGAVFDTANGFAAVYHFAPSDTFLDATWNSFDGTNNNTTPNSSAAIGFGRSFDGDGDYIQTTDSTLKHYDGGVTLSGWLNVTDYTDHHIAIWDGETTSDGTSGERIMLKTGNINKANNNWLRLYAETGFTDVRPDVSYGTTATWFYLTGTITGLGYNSPDGEIFFNGVSDEFDDGANSDIDRTGTWTKTRIGAPGDVAGAANEFWGSLDEIRIETEIRSDDWIKLCYKNQVGSVDVVTFGDVTDQFSEAVSLEALTITQTATTCSLYTDSWSLVFDEAKGSGICFLSSETQYGGTNQVNDSENLFSILYNSVESSSRSDGTLSLIDSTWFSATVRQEVTLSGETFTTDYTIYGSGRIFTRTWVAGEVSSNTLAFRVNTRSSTGTNKVIPATGTASSCPYILLANDSSTVLDPLFVPYQTMTGFAFDSSSSADPNYGGWSNSSYSQSAGDIDVYEFMIDFANQYWNDSSSSVLQSANDYRNRDSLEYLVGTQDLDNAWEYNFLGHWTFDENDSDSAADFSGNSRNGNIFGSSIVTGRIGYGIQMDGSGDTVLVDSESGFTSPDTMVIALWVKPSVALDASDVLFMVGDDSGTMDGYKLTGGAGGTIQFTIGNGSSAITTTGATGLGTGTWHHVAVRFVDSQDSVELFVDGEVDKISSSAFTQTSSAFRIEIGTNFSGVLDDIRLYGWNLTHEQIESLAEIAYRPGSGAYALRADNNNTVHVTMDGGTYNRHFPVFRITNYWMDDAEPIVYVNEQRWTNTASDTMFRVDLDTDNQVLLVGLDSMLTNDNMTIYIDDGNDSSAVWQTDPVDPTDWTVGDEEIIVQNFSGSTLGASGTNTWRLVIDRDCGGTSADSGCAGITDFYSSEVNASTDVGSATNLVAANHMLNPMMWEFTGSSHRDSSWGPNAFNGTALSIETMDTNDVYVKLMLDTAKIADATDTLWFTRQYTIYPTGKIFELFTVVHANNALDSLFPGLALSSSVAADTLIDDDFARADNSSLGGDWVESGEDASNYVAISSGNAVVTSADGANVPLFKHGSTPKSSGSLVWEFRMAWENTGGEGTYEMFMQLGDSSSMTDGDQTTGVAVNLRWGDATPGSVDGLSYVTSGGTTEMAVVQGASTIRVEVDLGNETYDVYVDDASQATNVAYYNSSTTISQMRIFTNGVNTSNFTGCWFDDVLLYVPASGGGTGTYEQYQDATDGRLTGIVRTGSGSFHGVGMAYLSYEDAGNDVSASSLVDDTLSIWDDDPVVLRSITEGGGTYYQTANLPFYVSLYYDISQDFTSGANVKTAMYDALYPTCIQYITGTKVTTDFGDLNADGFNEAEGCYVIAAENNTVKVGLGVTCDATQINTPAFKITNYTSAEKPQYVFLHTDDLGGGSRDTVRLSEGYSFSASLNVSTDELLVRIDSSFTDSVFVYLSEDDALAVQASGFWAVGGDRSDTLFWTTESEHENLGFMVYRRIKQSFLDSLIAVMDSVDHDADSGDAPVMLAKRGRISLADTSWVPVFRELVPGAKGGTSYGASTYKVVDGCLYNGVHYEYRLASVDFSGETEFFDEIAFAIPKVRLPDAFALFRNYPNPFRNQTFIRYNLPKKADIRLYLFDMRGRLVRRLVQPREKQNPGYYRVTWDGTDDFGRPLATGPYVYYLRANGGEFVKSSVMLLVR